MYDIQEKVWTVFHPLLTKISSRKYFTSMNQHRHTYVKILTNFANY